MSIFSKIKDAKQAANQHKASIAVARHAPVDTKATIIPYRHIPTHAAVDAFSGAPSSWKEEDRSAIKAQNKKRAMMGRDSGYKNSNYRSSALHRSDHHAMPLVLPPECQGAYLSTSTSQSSSTALKSIILDRHDNCYSVKSS